MNLIEILKANGIEDDVITKITGDMKTNMECITYESRKQR